MEKQFVWNYEPPMTRRPRKFIEVRRPCECGCDVRDGENGVGYIIGSDGVEGFTVWIEDEKVFKVIESWLLDNVQEVLCSKCCYYLDKTDGYNEGLKKAVEIANTNLNKSCSDMCEEWHEGYNEAIKSIVKAIEKEIKEGK